tara:strand:+ start:1828 stop:2364 length:537 start_codon:yes stop_codon:yes gene_type:complete
MSISKIQDAGLSLTSAALPAGSVLQVVSTVDTGFRSSGVNTFTEVSTAWRLSITPSSASSKLILSAQFCENRYSGAALTIYQAKFYDVTNSSNVFVGASLGSRNPSTITWRGSHGDDNDVDEHLMYAIVDASNTTARTYTIYYKSESGALTFFNRSTADNSTYGWTAPFIFTIMEIAA